MWNRGISRNFFMIVAVVLALAAVGCAPAEEETGEEATEAAAPAKIEVDLQTALTSAPDKVWKIVGDFAGADYVAAVLEVSIEGEGLGAVRTLTLPDNGEVVETLDALDNDARSLTYSILRTTLPIGNYSSTMSVSEGEGGGSVFRWHSSFTARGIPDEEAKAFVEGFYQGAFNDLKKVLGEPVEEATAE